MEENIIDPAVLIPDDEIFVRMNRAERWQHGLLVASFILLVATGLPLMSGEVGILKLITGRGGAYALRGILHRAAAVVLIGDLVWHALYTLLTERGRRNLREKLPRRKDVRDVFAMMGHNSGFSGFLRRRGLFRRFFERHPYWRFDRKPEFGRYGLDRKSVV